MSADTTPAADAAPAPAASSAAPPPATAAGCGLPPDALPSAPRKRWPRAPRRGLDLIGLALLRIGTAGWLLADLFIHPPAWPLAAQMAYTALALIAHLCLLAGWRGGLSAVASAAVVLARDGDPLLLALSVWCALLPCAARLAIDGIRRAPGGPPGQIAAGLFATHMLLLAALTFSWWPLLALAVALVPAAFWRVLPRLNRKPGVTMWFDGECGICGRAARLVGQMHGGQVDVRTIQEDPDVQALSARVDSFVVDAADGRRLTGWRAVRVLCAASPWLWPLAVPLPGGELLYRFIASHRHRPWWGWLAALPAEEPVPWWLQALVVAALVALTIGTKFTVVALLAARLAPGGAILPA